MLRAGVIARLAMTALFAVSGVALGASADEYEREWARLSAVHDRLIATDGGRDYERRLIDVQNTFWASIYAQCSADARKEGLASFRAIAVIDGNGVVTRFLTLPNSQNLACFTKGMVGRHYPVPPSVPFYERYMIFVAGG
jgi:hypothetical protein